MLNKDLSAKQAVETTKDLYKNHLLEVMGIATVGGIIPFVGSSIAASGYTLSAQQLTEYKKANLQTPKTHYLNYLIPLIILGFLVFLILLIGLVAFAASR